MKKTPSIRRSDPVNVRHYGGVEVVCDRFIRGLVTGLANLSRDPPLAVEFAAIAPPTDLEEVFRWTGNSGLTLYKAADGAWFLGHGDVAFWVNADATRIVCSSEDFGAHDRVSELLVRQILPRVLELRGRFVFHGSALATPSGAIAMVGPSSAGKSTLAAALCHHLEWPVLADDALVLEADTHVWVHPTSERVRLWEDARATLTPGIALATPLASRVGKFECELHQAAVPSAHALNTVYVLMPEGSAAHPVRHLAIELLRNRVCLNPAATRADATRFMFVTRLSAEGVIKPLCLPRQLSELGRVAQWIARDILDTEWGARASCVMKSGSLALRADPTPSVLPT